ncbi:MAG: hypothetical protein AB1742_13365, partial [bacterium]
MKNSPRGAGRSEKRRVLVFTRTRAAAAPLAACLCIAAWLGTQAPCRAAEAGKTEVTINLVFEDGRVMIYRGKEAGLKKGEEYEVVIGGESAGRVSVTETAEHYTIARVIEGKSPGEWEGRTATLKTAAPPEKEEKAKAKEEEKEKEKEK